MNEKVSFYYFSMLHVSAHLKQNGLILAFWNYITYNI